MNNENDKIYNSTVSELSFQDLLDKSISEMNNGSFISFSMKEFELYVAEQFGE